MQNCWNENFARSHDINQKDVGGIGYRTSGCGTYYELTKEITSI